MTNMESWKPEYVVSVNKGQDGTKIVTSNTLGKLESALKSGGFAIQVVKGNESETDLVFIKLQDQKYTELVDDELNKFVQFGITAKNTSDLDRARLIQEYLTTRSEDGGIGLTPLIGYWKDVTGITAVREQYKKTTLLEDIKVALKKTSLDSKSTFKVYGVQASLYFEFLNFYTKALVPLSIFGILSSFKSKKTFSLTYTIINLIWGITFIVLWNRREKYLVNFWGVQNSSLLDESFSFEKEKRSIKEDKIVSSKKGLRFLKQLAFIPIALAFASILIIFQLACFVLEIFLTEIYNGPGKSILSLLPTVLLTVFVPILTIIYNFVSTKALIWERHENTYTKNNSILFKTFVLNFLTTYMPLLITSFIYLPFAHLIQPNLDGIKRTISTQFNEDHFYYKYLIDLKTQEEFTMNQERLSLQYNYFIVTNQIIQLVLKYALPLIIRSALNFFKKNKTSNEKSSNQELWIQEVRKSTELPIYNADDDFRGLILQYGFLIIFGPIWSFAPFVSLLFNLLTSRLDYFKLSSGKYFRPVINNRIDSIFPWNYGLFILTWFGSVVSPLVTIFYRNGTKPPKVHGEIHFGNASVNVTSYKLVLLLFICEHAFFVLYFIESKVSEFFKSDAEWHNIEISKETNISARKTSLNTNEVTIGDNSNTYSTGMDQSNSVSEKDTASIAALEKVKETGDRIIRSEGKDGHIVYSTIDSNDHFVAPPTEDSDSSSENQKSGNVGLNQINITSKPDSDIKDSNKKVDNLTKKDDFSLKDAQESENSLDRNNNISETISDTKKELDNTIDTVNGEVDDGKSTVSSTNQKVTKRKTLKKLFNKK